MNLLFQIAAKRDRALLHSLSNDTGVNLKRRLRNSATALALLCGLHTWAMTEFEDMSVKDASWVTMTTVTTFGYGDKYATTDAGRASSAILLFLLGIGLLGQTVTTAFDLRTHNHNQIANGKKKWNMDNHVVFLNIPETRPELYLKRLMTEFRKSSASGATKPVILVSPELNNGLPADLQKLKVSHVNQDINDARAFEDSSLPFASVIVVLATDDTDPKSDSITFDYVSRARDANPNAEIIAESVLDENKDRLIRAGATRVIRPVRSMPELLLKAILAPGAEEAITDLLDTENEETLRYDVKIKAPWGQIAAQSILQDIGTAIGFIDAQGNTHTSFHPQAVADVHALLLLVRNGNKKQTADVQEMLKNTLYQTEAPQITSGIE